MMQKRTKKKNISSLSISPQAIIEGLNSLIQSAYSDLFLVYRKSRTQVAIEYLSGLIKCEKGHQNMERMVEKVDNSDYKRYIHFLSVSAWSYNDVNNATLKGADQALRAQKKISGKPTGLIFDETSHLKKGNKSVGVKRQYAGVSGKVDNCQVSVHTSLSNDSLCTLVGTSLFLPQEWVQDPQRCKAAGIPTTNLKHQTKPELALALVKNAIAQDVEFDFVGGDGLYGHNAELTRALDQLPGVLYVLDVHKDELVFLEEPTLSIPPKKGSKGRTPALRQPNTTPIQLQKYVSSLSDRDFTVEKVRKTAKGWKQVQVHTVTIWHWDGKEEKAQKRTLVITRGEKLKFSFSNGEKQAYTNKEWAYFQCSRYWVERCFDDCKNELGMSGYQVTGWLAWQHHMALVMMASLYILRMKIRAQDELPLLSVRDARLLVIATLFGTQKEVDSCMQQMEFRHQQRQRDIDRCLKKSILVK